MKDLIQTLKDIGLTLNEAKCYLTILETGTASIGVISKKSGIKRTSIYNYIDEMVNKGYLEKIIIRGTNNYMACKPEKLLFLKQQKINSFEKRIGDFNSINQASKKTPKVSYFEGPKEVQNVLREEVNCKKNAYYIFPAKTAIDAIGGVEVMRKIDQDRLDSNVHISAIRFRRKEKSYDLSKNGKKYKRSLRFAPGFFDTDIGLGLYDTGKVGFFSSKKESYGLLIESEELYNLMFSFFKMLWNQSIPAKDLEG